MAKKRKVTNKVQRGSTRIVSLRLRNEAVALLDTRAKELGVTRNNLVAHLVVLFASRTDTADLVAQINALPTPDAAPAHDLFA